MAKEFAKSFYSSKRWQDCRNGYAKSRGWLCENCLRRGIYTPGEIVHHMIEITPNNINTPEIALSWDNLELLCRQCHADKHPDPWQKVNEKKRKKRDDRLRYVVGSDGKISARPPSGENFL